MDGNAPADEHDTFLKLSDATAHHMHETFTGFTPGRDGQINLEFYYPILVVEGELLAVRVTSKGAFRVQAIDHVVYRRSTISRMEHEHYFIDVVTERSFPVLLETIEQEMKKTCRLIRRRRERMANASKRVMKLRGRLRSPEKIRKAMEY